MENTHDTPSGRTCRARYQAIRDETSSPSSVRSSKPPVATELMYLNLGGGVRQENLLGETPVASWEKVIRLRGECWTPNTGESPKDAAESSLSAILQESAPEKYFLSARACREAGKEAAADAVGSTGGDYRVFDITGATSNSMKSRTPDSCFRERTVARTLDTFSGSPECNQGGNVVVFDARGNGDGQIVPTITGDHENRVTDYTALAVGNGQLNQIYMTDTAGTLTCSHDQQMICAFMGGQGAKAGGIGYSETVSPTLKAAPSGNNTVPDIAYWLKKARRYFVRRFTPLECCRLQGFPDWWEDGINGSDSARYKMWGNGMALPCVLYVMEGIADADRSA